MGTIIDATYKTTYLIPEEPHGILRILMESNKIGEESYRRRIKHQNVDKISIVAGELTQSEFDDLIHTLSHDANKPIYLFFKPIAGELETLPEAHERYARNYISDDPNHRKFFPKNIFMSTIIREETKKKLLQQ